MSYENFGLGLGDIQEGGELGYCWYDDPESESTEVVSLADFLAEREKRLEAERLADMDAKIEGVLNDRGMRKAFDTIQATRTAGDVIVLCYLDINEFKQTNSAIGHIAADEALADYAAYLLSTTREGDAVARHGGDEFVILANCANVEVDSVEGFLQRIQQPVDAIYKTESGFRTHEVSASVGVTIVEPGQEYSQAMERANMASRWIKDGHYTTGIAINSPGLALGLLDPKGMSKYIELERS